jgi:hypothetical protein
MSEHQEPLDTYVQWIAAEARRPVAMDPAARERLLQAIRAEPVPARRTRVLSWLLEPRRVAMPPLASAALAAGLIGIGVVAGNMLHRDSRQSAEGAMPLVAGNPQLPDSLAPRTIKFVLAAPQAARVSVVGDFNGWDASATPMRAEGENGRWTVWVPLQPGLHTYTFVVDGDHFVADPTAPIAPDDGFGHRNSVVFVGGTSL